jgi:hypothetical protein
MDCGSGFPAANRFNAGSAHRGWKAAPTTKPTPKILKLTRMRGNDGGVARPVLKDILDNSSGTQH